jgi:hypothetical protein
MKTKEKVRKRDSGTDSEPSRIPKRFVCIDPARKPLVLDFLMDFKQDLKDAAIMHLRLCLHCREMTTTVLKINRYLESKSRQTPQTEETLDEDHHSSHATTEDHRAERCQHVGEEDQETDLSTSSSSI